MASVEVKHLLSEKFYSPDRFFKDDEDENMEPRYKRERRLEISRSYARATSNVMLAPMSWSADILASGTALHLLDDLVYVATNDGRVIKFTLEGTIVSIHKLCLPVACFIEQDEFLYAWCPARNPLGQVKGVIYDVCNEQPRRVAQVTDFGIVNIHATVVDNLVVLCDNEGSLRVQTLWGDLKWEKQQNLTYAGLLTAERSGIYVGHKRKLVKYSLEDGEEIWSFDIEGRHYKIECYEQNSDWLFLVVNGKVLQVNKTDGSLVRQFCPRRHKASGIGISRDRLITGSCPSVIFNLETGEEMYRVNFAGRLGEGCMKIHSSGLTFTVWDRLYCLDLSPESVTRALEGTYRGCKEIKINAGFDCSELMEAQYPGSFIPDGSLVKVTRDGDRLVANPGGDYHNETWPVLMPLQLLQEGAHYVVAKLVPSEEGMFYRIRDYIFYLTQDPSAVTMVNFKDLDYGETEPEADDTTPPEPTEQDTTSQQ